MRNIAFLGLGIMGSGMAANLIKAGFAVTVYNRTAAKTEPLVAQGARAAATPREAAQGAECIISMVADDDASREEAGASVHWTPVRAWTLDLGGAGLISESGFRATGRVTWRPDRRGAVGLEVSWLDARDNAYGYGRLFGSRQFGRVTAALDLQAMAFDQKVNGEKSSLLGSASLGYPIARGLTATLAGSAGVTPLYQNRFDLIFLDVDMPGMDGFELCKKIRTSATNKSTPVVFVTSVSEFENRSRSTLNGGHEWIAKPFLLAVDCDSVLGGKIAERGKRSDIVCLRK